MPSDHILLIVLGAFLIISPLLKNLLERVNVPALVGYIALGFALSAIDRQWPFITANFENTFTVLAQLGVVALLFRVGLKSHTRVLLAKLPQATLIWLGDFLTNLVLGFVVSYYALALTLETSLVIATAFSATSVAVSASVWQEMDKLGTSKGQLLVDVAELDDLSGVLLLAILLAILPVLQEGGGELWNVVGMTTLTVLLKLTLFITGCYLFAHYVEADFTRLTREIGDSAIAMTIAVLGAGLAIAAFAEYLGFSLAIGALFAGLAFSRDPRAVRTDAKIGYFFEFFTPFFFIYIGLQLDPVVIAPSIALAVVLGLVAAVAKFAGVAVPALTVLKKHDAAILGISMIPRAEIALVIVLQCRQLGENVVPDGIYSAIVLVSIITSVAAPLTLRPLLSRHSKDR